MARSVFYYHLKYLKAKDKYAMERETIKAIYHEHKGRYGYRRVTAEMRNRGFVINHKTVQRLMNEMCLKSRIRKVRYRSYKGEVGKIAPNILARNFDSEARTANGLLM
ncbi:IS3 family transposase [Bacteroides faecichinchillae]|uniref:IS3 family transposase n=1 Tax=Bacteroides faecichinchillae TaxID=871325 RepID=UPI0009DCE174|nr:IS3 family transposase [Bacteroides faecichinchillae]